MLNKNTTGKFFSLCKYLKFLIFSKQKSCPAIRAAIILKPNHTFTSRSDAVKCWATANLREEALIIVVATDPQPCDCITF